jgi:hypothetical protein
MVSRSCFAHNVHPPPLPPFASMNAQRAHTVRTLSCRIRPEFRLATPPRSWRHYVSERALSLSGFARKSRADSFPNQYCMLPVLYQGDYRERFMFLNSPSTPHAHKCQVFGKFNGFNSTGNFGMRGAPNGLWCIAFVSRAKTHHHCVYRCIGSIPINILCLRAYSKCHPCAGRFASLACGRRCWCRDQRRRLGRCDGSWKVSPIWRLS